MARDSTSNPIFRSSRHNSIFQLPLFFIQYYISFRAHQSITLAVKGPSNKGAYPELVQTAHSRPSSASQTWTFCRSTHF